MIIINYLTVFLNNIFFKCKFKVQQELKGKADDKVYRGLANYAQYYEKKDTGDIHKKVFICDLIHALKYLYIYYLAQGNAASANVRKGPMRAPANIRATVRWDCNIFLCFQ